MASNFHDIFGFLAIGVDVHKGLRPVPAPPGFIPELFAEVVAIHPFILGPGQKPTVKFNGVNSVVDGHTSYVSWPHLPIAPPNILFPIDLIFGTHSCWLPRSTVQIDGTMSTCAIAACVSTDLDCWEWAPIPSDLTLPQIAGIRGAINAPIDFYVEAPDNIGGFIRHFEIPELIRVTAPVYLKFGLRNAPDIYPAGTHIEGTALALSRERVRRAQIAMEMIARYAAGAVMSPLGAADLGIPA